MNFGSKTSSTAAEETIRALGRQHGIDASRVHVDDWVDKIGQLSGQDDSQADEVEQILINLRRAGAISAEHSQELLLDYLDTKLSFG